MSNFFNALSTTFTFPKEKTALPCDNCRVLENKLNEQLIKYERIVAEYKRQSQIDIYRLKEHHSHQINEFNKQSKERETIYKTTLDDLVVSFTKQTHVQPSVQRTLLPLRRVSTPPTPKNKSTQTSLSDTLFTIPEEPEEEVPEASEPCDPEESDL